MAQRRPRAKVQQSWRPLRLGPAAGAEILADALLNTSAGKRAARGLDTGALYRGVTVRLLRLHVMAEARRRGLVGRGATISGGQSWLFSAGAGGALHGVRLSDAAADAALREVALDSPARVYESLLALRPTMAGGRLKVGEQRHHLRKELGSYYTPSSIASDLLKFSVAPSVRSAMRSGGREGVLSLRVCDPACGVGNFLLPVLRRIGLAASREPGNRRREPVAAELRAALPCVYGVDIDPIAAEMCRVEMWLAAGDARLSIAQAGANIKVADSLLADWRELFAEVMGRGGFDAVIGNPPFLNQLEKATAHRRDRVEALRRRFGDAVRPYTDPAALFLLLSAQIAKRGSRATLIQPQSVLASRDAAGVREALQKSAPLESLWLTSMRTFDANVVVCAPTIKVGARPGPVRPWRDGCRSLPADPAELNDAGTWAPLAADAAGVPRLSLSQGGLLADIAAATADFRDQYYGLRGMVVEDASLNGVDRSGYPPLITSGLIGVGRSLWGQTPARFDRQRFDAPRIDLKALSSRTELGPWSRARLVPKVLLATQTRVLEAVADSHGSWLPAVPVITVTPRRPHALWLIAAVLLSPVASVWAARRYSGAGLSAGAIKLSARQVLGIPLPGGSGWESAAALLERASTEGPGAREPELTEVADLMCRAYGLPVNERESALRWWQDRVDW